MIWIEMSKDVSHGGKGWEFSTCLWSPAYKIVNEQKRIWSYWESVKHVKEGDIVLHLRGDTNPAFVGFSTAESDGFITDLKPIELDSKWDFAEEFYRVNLKDFELFSEPLLLSELFWDKKEQLRYYFNVNKNKKKNKRLLFYVIQNEQLRRQNGAYLSEVDSELYGILFDREKEVWIKERPINSQINAYSAIKSLPVRVGQNEFSNNVRSNFGEQCCFPDCDIKDRNFLVASHIARWTDRPEARGQTSNGLCLCLYHDKAFEIGLFTLDVNLMVSVNKERLLNFYKPINEIIQYHGYQIKKPQIEIDQKYLMDHWKRIGYEPKD